MHTFPADGYPTILIVREQNTSGKNGPSHGMRALQHALQARIASGLDWLSIGPLINDDQMIPWFWKWSDRRAAVSWAAQGRPFAQGPNVLFLNSSRPRIDELESALLDSKHCHAMFCHSDWYRQRIAKHRAETNKSPIYTFPYPIAPWPGEPLADLYDLLIYSKNGRRPKLVEHLTERFPRHRLIRYGAYERDELFDAARRSRACAYLADNDHGPLALQEILLAGCPTVGVHTGAPYVTEGRTGFLLEHLPPGAAAVASDFDQQRLDLFESAIEKALWLDRRVVREFASTAFNEQLIVDNILKVLQLVRQSDCILTN
jgi:hypothetical protein